MMYRISSKKLKKHVTLDKEELERYVLEPLGYSYEKEASSRFKKIIIEKEGIILLLNWMNKLLKKKLDNHEFLPKDTRCGKQDGFYDFSLFGNEYRLFSLSKKDRIIIHLTSLYFFLEYILNDEDDFLKISNENARGIRIREKYFSSSKMNYTHPGLNIRINIEKEIIGNKLLLKIKYYAISYPIEFYFPENPPFFSRKHINAYNDKNEPLSSIFLSIGSYLPNIPMVEKIITTENYHEYIHECEIEKKEDGRTELHLGSTTYSLKDGKEYYLTVWYSNKASNRLKISF